MENPSRFSPRRAVSGALVFAALALLAWGLPSCGKQSKPKPAKSRSGTSSKETAGKENASPKRPRKEIPPAPKPGHDLEPPAPPEAKVDDSVPPVRMDASLVENVPDRWYRTEKEGRPTGYFHVRWSYVEEGGRRLVLDETESVNYTHRKIGHMNDLFPRESRHVTLRTQDGELIRSESEVEEGDPWERRVSSGKMEKTEGGYTFTHVMLRDGEPVGERTEKFHHCTETIHLDAESFIIPFLRAGKVKEGEVFKYSVISGEEGTIHSFEVRYLDTRSFLVGGRPEKCVGVEVRHVETGSLHREYFRQDGLLVRVDSGENASVLTSEAEVGRLRELIESGRLIDKSAPVRDAGLEASDVGLDLHGAFNLYSLTMEVTVRLRRGVPEPIFENSPFQEVISAKKVDDGTFKAVLRSKAHDRDVTAPWPLETEGMEKYLKETVLMQVNHPLVKKAAKEAVGDAKDARTAAQRIVDFSFNTIQRGGDSGSIAQYSAVEILQNGQGDCSEHALLFVALCRAAGIPARQTSGYVCLGRSWGNHAWAEIWVGDWIGADPCTRDIGTRARYIFFGYQDDPFGKGGVTSQAFTGHSSIRLLEGTFEDGEAVDLTGREALCGVGKDGTGFHLTAGIALKKARPDWNVRASDSFAQIMLSGSKINATIRVMPDQGYRELERYVGAWGQSTRTTLEGFPAVVVGRSDGYSCTVVVNSLRRNIQIQLIYRTNSIEEREKLWNDFFRSLDITAWKGKPVEPSDDYPAFRPEAKKIPPGEEGGEED